MNTKVDEPAGSENSFVPLLEARAIRRYFGVEGGRVCALEAVSLTVASEEFLVITGPSGSGKSTLLHLLSGLDTPSEGDVLFQGQTFVELGAQKIAALRNRHFGFIFQTPHLLPEKNILENVALPFSYGSKVAASVYRQRCRELLAYVGMADMGHRYPATLSGGEMQRVVFARAMVREPKIIFADEPTGSLDAENSDRLLRLLREQADAGRTVIMVTHDPVAERFGSRSIRLEKVSRQRSGL